MLRNNIQNRVFPVHFQRASTGGGGASTQSSQEPEISTQSGEPDGSGGKDQETPKHRKLFDELSGRGLYTKSYDEFSKQFSTADKVGKLHGALRDRELVTIDRDTFRDRYFGDVLEGQSQGTPDEASGDDPSDLRRFYDEINEAGVVSNLPDYDTFKSRLSDPENRETFYDELSQAGAVSNLPDYETFNNTLFPDTLENEAEEDDILDSSSAESPESGEREGGNTQPLPDSQGEGDSGDEPGFFGQVARTFWNTATQQIPSALKAGLSATLSGNIASDPRGDRFMADADVQEALGQMEESVREGISEERQRLLDSALEGFEDFQASQEGLVTKTGDIHDSIDILNYVGNSLAQASAQIPASVLSFGATSVGQEVGMIYMDQVKKIAEREGISPREVIEKDLDNRASAIAYGSFAGALDYLGARGAARAVPFKKFSSDIANRALGMLGAATGEAGTEGSQSVIEQFGASQGAGDSVFESITNVSVREAGEEALAGAIGGGGISAGGIFARDIADAKQRLQDPNLSREERIEAEREVQELTTIAETTTRNQVDNPFVTGELGPGIQESAPEAAQQVAGTEQETTADTQQEGDTPQNQESSPEQQTPKTITLSPINESDNQSFQRPGQFRRTMEKWFFQKGSFPEQVFKRNKKRVGLVDREYEKAKQLAFDLNESVNEVYQPKGRIQSFLSGEGFQKQEVPAEAYSQINDVLRGQEDTSVLPEGLREPVSTVRSHIDRLSRKLIDSGLAEGELEAVVDKNIGVYLNRSYRVHDDPKWADNVPEDIRNRAKGFIRQQYIEQRGIGPSDQLVDNIIRDILYEEGAPISILSGSKVGSKDFGILRKRSDIAPEIRALMGEYTDPVKNYARSVEKMANLIENHRFLEDVRQQGLGDFLFTQEDPNRPKGFHAKIAPEETDVLAPLGGLYTTPEIKEAFERSFQQANSSGLFRVYMRANSVVKLANTAGSAPTQVRNIKGGLVFMLNNGINPLTAEYKKAFNTVKQLFKPTNQEGRKRLQRWRELGIVGGGARSGEIQQYIDDAQVQDAENVGELFRALEESHGLWDKAKKGVRSLSKVYQAGDTFIRGLMFEAEVQRYQDALPDASIEEVEQLAADIVLGGYQDYSNVPRAVEEFRKVPITGTFASFPAEVIRTEYNTAKRAVEEIKSDNPAIRKIGMKRAAGMISMLGIASQGVQQATQAFWNITDDEDRDWRRFLPPWSRLSSIAYTSKGDGTVEYVDLSYTDPYEYLKDPIMHLLTTGQEDQDFLDKLGQSIGEFAEPFAGEEILLQHLREAVSNKKTTGGTVYNPEDPEWIKDFTYHIAQAFEPGTMRQGRRLVKAYKGEKTDYGRKYDVPKEILGLIGTRVTEVDIGRSLLFKGRDFNHAYRNDRKIFNDVYYSEGETPQQAIDAAYEKANAQFKENWESLREDIEAAYRLGLSREEIYQQLEKAQVPEWIREDLRRGRFRKFERPDND